MAEGMRKVAGAECDELFFRCSPVLMKWMRKKIFFKIKCKSIQYIGNSLVAPPKYVQLRCGDQETQPTRLLAVLPVECGGMQSMENHSPPRGFSLFAGGNRCSSPRNFLKASVKSFCIKMNHFQVCHETTHQLHTSYRDKFLGQASF